jgi:DNA-binding Lrp family transcriptional regulator
MHEIDQRDRELLAAIQTDLPLISTPYAGLGQVIDMSEKEVLKRCDRLKREGALKQISAIFDARNLGYRSCLVAARVGEERIERAASVINLHPGVTQNYRRNHEFDLWFTIAVPPDSLFGLEKTVEMLAAEAECQVTRLLPTLRQFRNPADGLDGSELAVTESPLTETEIEIVKLLQTDLPLQPRPFDLLARTTTFSSDEILETARELQRRGQLRRLAGIVQAKKQTFSASAMGVWQVPDADVDRVCPRMAASKGVSQCFLRPTYEDWPYNVFTTVHGRSVDECESILEAIADEVDIHALRVLFPVKEYKRGRITFFSPDIRDWEQSRSATAAQSTVAS